MTDSTQQMGKNWGDVKKPQGGGDRTEILRIRLDKDTTKVRFLGNVLPRYVRWVTTNEGKKYPLECLSFNRDTEEFVRTKDPFNEISEEVYNEKPQFAYVSNVIDRADGKVKLLDLKTTVFKQLVDYAKDPDYGSPSDPRTGYDVTIKKEKTGPLPQNVKYTVMPSRSTVPLTDAELQMEAFNLESIYKRQTYEEQKEWLIKNTALFMDESADDLGTSETMEDI